MRRVGVLHIRESHARMYLARHIQYQWWSSEEDKLIREVY